MSFHTNTRMTSQHVDKMMANRRHTENEQRALLNYTSKNRLQSEANMQDRVIENRRRSNKFAQMAGESILQTQFSAPEKQEKQHLRRQEQNIKLVNAMENGRREKEREALEIQRICDNSEELRELESKLKVAYMNKERAVQQTEKATLDEMERQRQMAMNNQMEYDRQRALAEAANEDMIKKANAVKEKQMIQQQMLERLALQEEAAKEAEMDKQKVEALMAQLQAEDDMEMKRRADRVANTRKIIDQSIHQRQVDLQERKRMEQEEEERVAAYARHRAAREATIKAKNDERKRKEEEQFKAVEAEIRRKQEAEDTINQLRDELWTEELHLERKRKEKAKLDKIQRDKDEMMQSNALQLQRKAQWNEEERKQAEEYNEFLRQKYAQQAEQDRMVLQTKSQEKQQYKEDIVKQNQARQSVYQRELQREQMEAAKIQEAEDYEKRVIEEAKKRLIEQHKAKLEGYLPKGVEQTTLNRPF